MGGKSINIQTYNYYTGEGFFIINTYRDALSFIVVVQRSEVVSI